MKWEKANDETVLFIAVGDISFSDGVEDRIRGEGKGEFFSEVSEIFDKGDLIFGNLESPLTDSKVGRKAQAHLLKASTDIKDVLKDMRFDIVSLSNNHILDFGEAGMNDTLNVLNDIDVKYVGAGTNLMEARKPVVISRKGIKFGFLAYSMKGVNSAEVDSPGASRMIYDEMREDIVNLRNDTDFLIVSIHTGLEFIEYPHPDYREIAHKLVDDGVDLIIGHHPHVVQGVEKKGESLICYSLGNFVFDHSLMDYKTELSKETFIFAGLVKKEGMVDYEIIPLKVNDEFRPVPLNKTDAERFQEKLTKISDNLATDQYPRAYFEKAKKIWPYINIRVNLKIIREQGIRAFLKRLPRLKMIYIVLLIKYIGMNIMKIPKRLFFTAK